MSGAAGFSGILHKIVRQGANRLTEENLTFMLLIAAAYNLNQKLADHRVFLEGTTADAESILKVSCPMRRPSIS